MPTYHYRCSDCGHSFDFFQKFADDTLTSAQNARARFGELSSQSESCSRVPGGMSTTAEIPRNRSSAPKTESGDKATDSGATTPKETSEKKAAAAVGEA